MFVTRATRHDKDDLRELLESHGWDANVDEGTAFIAREGKIVGCVRLVEVEPQTLVIDDVLVREDRRREGIATRLMQTVMNSRRGTMYLCCHKEVTPFYERFGFNELSIDKAPESAVAYWRRVGAYPPPDCGHEHCFMKAR